MILSALVSALTHAAAFVVGGICGVIGMAVLRIAADVFGDDPAREAAADALGLRPDQIEWRDGRWVAMRDHSERPGAIQ